MSKNLFNSIKLMRPKKNVFDLSHDVKLSGRMGNLIPTCIMECVPGDKFDISCQSMLRFSPLVAPVMHRMDVYMHYFFVPNRILWPNWEKFITNTKVGADLPAFPTLTISSGNYTKLADYLGIPNVPAIPVGISETVNAFPFAAYQKVWNDYYRDQNLQDDIAADITLVDGAQLNNEFLTLRKRAWEHDYFTSALPFAQKGDAVSLPIGEFEDVPVKRNAAPPPNQATIENTDASLSIVDNEFTFAGAVAEDHLYADTSTLTGDAATINDLRRAFRLQEWLEKAARGGSRYVESILNHFGVKSSDKRLQRPEYITGAKSPVVISEVLNTTGTESLPQGNMSGHAISVGQGRYGSYYCEEHGYIIGIMSVMPKTAYQQGLDKHWLKINDPFQYYWPSFANIGEQEVLNKEVYAFQAANGNDTFGYVPRYAEYKFMQNRVAGDFRNTLDFWHLGRIFAAPPNLNEDFIMCEPDTRIFAVEDDTDYLYCQILHNIKAVRPMPKFGTPMF